MEYSIFLFLKKY